MTDDPVPFELGQLVTWSENDLTNSLAFMRQVPSPFIHGLYGLQNREGFAEYLKTFQDDVKELLGHLFTEKKFAGVTANYYQVPPDAGADADFIITLARNIDAMIQTVDAYVSLGSLLIPFFQRRKARDEAVDEGREAWPPSRMYTGVRMLESMCLFHAHSSYYDPSRHPDLRIETYSRSVHVGAVDHPAPGVQYTINVRVGSNAFVYVIQSDAYVIDQFKITDGNVTGLTRPDFLGEATDAHLVDAQPVSSLLPQDDS